MSQLFVKQLQIRSCKYLKNAKNGLTQVAGSFLKETFKAHKYKKEKHE